MDSSKAANWLQILGNLGLIVGLVLVAVQIKQNNDLAKAQLLSDGWLAGIQWNLAQIGENPAISIARASAAPDQLTDEDLIVLDGIVAAHRLLGTRAASLDAAGYRFYPVEGFAHVFVQQTLNSPFGIAWWNDVRQQNKVAPEEGALADLIDREITELGTDAGRGQLEHRERIRAHIAEHWSSTD
jgi:hypothetical protein